MQGLALKSYLSSASCSGDDRRCSAAECCDLITCAVNNGETAGKVGIPFLESDCKKSSTGGGTNFTIRTNSDQIICRDSSEKCLATDCCLSNVVEAVDVPSSTPTSTQYTPQAFQADTQSAVNASTNTTYFT